MTIATASRWEVTDVAEKIGSTIHTDKQTLLSGERAQEIREIMERRGVIVFPQINLTDDPGEIDNLTVPDPPADRAVADEPTRVAWNAEAHAELDLRGRRQRAAQLRVGAGLAVDVRHPPLGQ